LYTFPSNFTIDARHEHLRWVRDIYLRNVTRHPGQLSLAIPSWVGVMSTSHTAVTTCGWEVKAGMVRVWVACKTV